MAIKRDSQQIGVQPSGRLVREFRTDLPEPTIGATISRFGSNLGEVGEGLMKQEADKAAKEAIASAPVKDENGNYIAPMPPENFGPYAARVFSDAVDTRYKNNVVQDFQTKLNEIAAANQNDPVRAHELMMGHATGALKGADPRFAKDFEATFIREVNERQRGILNLNASRERESTIRDLQIQATRYNEQAIDAWSRSAGNPEMEAEARRLEGEAYKTQQRLVEMKADTPMGLQQLENTQRANRFSGTVISALNRSIEEGTITPEALADLHLISQGLGGNKSVTIGGMTVSADQVLREVSDPRVRQMLGNRINVVRNDMARSFERDTLAENARRINDYFTTNPNAPGFPANVTPEQQRYAVETWATSNGVNPFTPEGFQIIFNRYGTVPEKMYGQTFSNLSMKTAGQLEALRPLYETMGSVIVRDGTRRDVRAQALDAKDDAFMSVYTTLRGNNQGLDPVAAAEAAKRVVEKGIGRLTESSANDVLMKQYRLSRGNQATMADLYGKIKSATDFDLTTMSDDARESLLTTTATFVAMDIPLDEAMNRAGMHFKKNFEANKYTLDFGMKGSGGFTPKATNPSALRSADGSAGYDYLDPLVKLTLSESADTTQFFTTPLDKLEVGKNVWLKPVGTSPTNPAYQVWYYEKGTLPQPVRSRDGSIVTMFTGRYMKAQEDYSGNALIEMQRTPRNIAPVDLPAGADLMGAFPGGGAPEASPVRSEFPAYLKPRPEHVQPPFMIRKMLEGRNSDRIDLQTLPKGTQKRSDVEGNIRTVSTGDSRLMADAGSATITRAMDFLGVDERNGKAVLTDFFKKTLGEDIDPTKVPWCAVWANGILRETGYLGTNSKLARSFLAYGETPEKPSNGDIVVLRRGSSETTGHVGFFMGYKEQNGRQFVRVLGGNQNDTVSEQLFPADQVLGIRRPVKLQEARNLPGVDGTVFSELEGDIG